MRAIEYALRQGWSSLWRARGASALGIVTIGLALVVLGAVLLLTWNVERLLERWAAAAEFSVYLRDDATSEQRGAIEALLDRSDLVSGREYVSKGEAFSRFRLEFSDLAIVADGFDDNPFPASVEVRVRPEAEDDARVEELVRRVATLPGVADVRYDREWLAMAAAGLRGVRAAGLAFALLMGVAAAITVAAVVRLGLQARRHELEIMELVGAPFSFIRGPFVAEGVLQGGVGALVAIAMLWGGFLAVQGAWGDSLTALLEGDRLAFLPPRLLLALVTGGMGVGGLGGLIAARHAGSTATPEPGGEPA
jgi:cell division transport system permease protein